MNINQVIKASIKEVFVFWSESTLINNEMGADESFDINKAVSIDEFNALADKAAQLVDGGYDKTKVKVIFHDGSEFNCRLDITKSNKCIVELLKHYLN